MNGAYLTVAGRIRQELIDLQRLVDRTMRIWEFGLTAENDFYVDAAALNLHGFYAGLERVFELIADGIDQSKPDGPAWHQDLLRQMTSEVPGIRPAVLTTETRDQLDRFRGFRHVVRNVYTVHLDPQQISILIDQLTPTAVAMAHELRRLPIFWNPWQKVTPIEESACGGIASCIDTISLPCILSCAANRSIGCGNLARYRYPAVH
jgi:hypothetical protein